MHGPSLTLSGTIGADLSFCRSWPLKMLEQLSHCLNAESAQRIVALRIDPEIQARVEVLADKANEGLLSQAERDGNKNYIEMADLIAILKLKAQRPVPSNGPV